MKPPRKPALPPELDAHLRDEPEADELGRMWDLLGEAAPPTPSADTEAAWSRVRAATLGSPRERRAQDRPPRRTRRTALRTWTPILGVVLALAAWLWVAVPVSVTAPAGSFATVALPDGSVVELNSGSTLGYRRGFWKLPFVDAPVRAVRLDGEAYFAVERGARPFVVQTDEARVEVLGTAFNVRTRENATVVTVAEGRVRVEGERGGQVELAAGERARVAGGAPEAMTTGARQALAWRSRGFAAQRQPLAAILAELERRYALDLHLAATHAADDTLTLYFPQPTDAEAILRDICTERSLNYRRTSRGFEVY